MLLERDAELELLRSVVNGIGPSGGKVVLVRGEAGIGKSALVSELARTCGPDVRVLHGACDDLFIPMPLSPFWDVAREEPSLQQSLDDGDRPQFMRALLDALHGARPTLLIIEDTHWADEATLDAIRFVGRRIARASAVVVLTFRDGEVDLDHPLRAVVGDIPAGDVVRVKLERLTPSAVSALVAGSGLDPAHVFEVTGGNPLLVREMAAATTNGTALSLDDAVMARMRRLSIGAQETVKTLSVLPEPVPRADLLDIAGIDDDRLDEGLQRELLEEAPQGVTFRHELIRNVIESALTSRERIAKSRAVLDGLPDETHPCLIVVCALQAGDVDRLLKASPRSARYASAVGSHLQSVADYRTLGPHLDRIDPDERAALLEEWAREEFLVDEISEAIRLGELARDHHRARGDGRAESLALARLAHYAENDGQRARAEALAREAVDVLGARPDGADLARALEANAYLAMMAGNVRAVPALVARTLEAGGPDIDEAIRIRSLNHNGLVANIATYPDGRADLDEARARAEAAGQWYEECRALFNHAWAAAEAHDLPIASDYAQRAIASAVRHELRGLESYARAMFARVLELEGRWDDAMDLARDVAGGATITRMAALPIIGAIEARRGRASAQEVLAEAWGMAVSTGEFQRVGPVAIPIAEHAWLTDRSLIAPEELEGVMAAGLELGFSWSPGRIAAWLWRLGVLRAPPAGIAQPYRMLMEGDVTAAAATMRDVGAPYEQALMLMHGQVSDQVQALEIFETLGAVAVAARLRQQMRAAGVAPPRGRGRATRRHAAGLTARQAEVLRQLDEGLSNLEIADRLFVSPRTVETHVAAILDKLDVATRERAVELARADGLLA